MNESPPVFYRTSSPLGPLPISKKEAAKTEEQVSHAALAKSRTPRVCTAKTMEQDSLALFMGPVLKVCRGKSVLNFPPESHGSIPNPRTPEIMAVDTNGQVVFGRYPRPQEF